MTNLTTRRLRNTSRSTIQRIAGLTLTDPLRAIQKIVGDMARNTKSRMM